MTYQRPLALLFVLSLLSPLGAMAEEQAANDETQNFEIVMKNREFSPLELVVPADRKIKITVKNEDLSPIEFESVHLNREKIVQPHGEVQIFFNPLKAGTYRYNDDFNQDSKGYITVK